MFATITLKTLNVFRVFFAAVSGLVAVIALLGGIIGLTSIFLPHPATKPLAASAIGQMLWVATAAWAIFSLLTSGGDQIEELRRLIRRETSINYCISFPVTVAVCLATIFSSPFWFFPIYLGWNQAITLLSLPSSFPTQWGWTIFWFVWVLDSFLFAWILENPAKRLHKALAVNILPLLLIIIIHLSDFIG
jgi:hypothetical protein